MFGFFKTIWINKWIAVYFLSLYSFQFSFGFIFLFKLLKLAFESHSEWKQHVTETWKWPRKLKLYSILKLNCFLFKCMCVYHVYVYVWMCFFFSFFYPFILFLIQPFPICCCCFVSQMNAIFCCALLRHYTSRIWYSRCELNTPVFTFNSFELNSYFFCVLSDSENENTMGEEEREREMGGGKGCEYNLGSFFDLIFRKTLILIISMLSISSETKRNRDCISA